MSRIRGKNTKPELLVRKYLHANGVRYRLHAKLSGKPDILIAKRKLAVFVNGCFWHCHKKCDDFRLPKTRTDYWQEKLMGNAQRDMKNYDQLERDGWRIFVLWECELKKNYEGKLKELLDAILCTSLES